MRYGRCYTYARRQPRHDWVPPIGPTSTSTRHFDRLTPPLHGDRGKALGALKEASRITPQQTRYHPQVHETVRILAEHDRRATDSLAGFARWLGVTL
jgi:hypothetical protein